MLNSGDVVDLDLGVPAGREAGFDRPTVVLTAQAVLDRGANVVQVVPLSSTSRGFVSEVKVEPDAMNGLKVASSAQCQHIRAVSTSRISHVRGNVGGYVLEQLRDTVALILDIS